MGIGKGIFDPIPLDLRRVEVVIGGVESRIDSRTRRGHGHETAENPPPAPHAASPDRAPGHPLVLCGPSETAVGVLLGSREELGFLRADPPEIGVPAQSPEPRIPPVVYRRC